MTEVCIILYPVHILLTYQIISQHGDEALKRSCPHMLLLHKFQTPIGLIYEKVFMFYNVVNQILHVIHPQWMCSVLNMLESDFSGQKRDF